MNPNHIDCLIAGLFLALASPVGAARASGIDQVRVRATGRADASTVAPGSLSVRIGNFLLTAPCGIAFVVDDDAAFVVDTEGAYYAGTAAPDDSFHHCQFARQGATIQFDWGRVADAAVARLTSDKPVRISLRLGSGWPGWKSRFMPNASGVNGQSEARGRLVTWKMRTVPAPVSTSDSEVVVALAPGAPLRFVAGLGTLPATDQVDRLLAQARNRYTSSRPAATGDWGDFVGAIADNLNNSRIYSSDNHRLAHSVSRGWANGDPNKDPYFCWDSFFTANLACLDDPQAARETVRAILSYQTLEGMVPNFAHAWGGVSDDRSQPPVGALCVWKMHQRWPDKAFLSEVYPKPVKWHEWWPKARDSNRDGLLEWGSATGVWQNAQYETGWDDNLHFAGTRMAGSVMNADAVDLNSLWSMDAEYLARIASALGRSRKAAQFRSEHEAMNRRINERLWNEQLGMYCSLLWRVKKLHPVDSAAFGAGFDAVFYRDQTLGREAGARHDSRIDFDWNKAAPMEGVPGEHWSARWTGTFTPPVSDRYRFITTADDGVRVFVGGRKVIDGWAVQPPTEKDADVDLPAGVPTPVVVEYFQATGVSSLHFSVSTVHAANPDTVFLTRLTPMNFYPLIAGVPDERRAKRVMAVLTDPRKFWGAWVLPTLAYDDPDYHQQEYWRGDIWGPVNYLVFQGLKRYASPAQRTEFARKSVALFMKNWTNQNDCGENYLSTDGAQSRDRRYTWGALLNLIGVENICDAGPDGTIQLNAAQTQTIQIQRLPIHGQMYEVRTWPGRTELRLDGRIEAISTNAVTH